MKHISPVPSNYRQMRITGSSRHQQGGAALGTGVSTCAGCLGGHRGELWVRGGKQSWGGRLIGSRDWGGKQLIKRRKDPISKGSP